MIFTNVDLGALLCSCCIFELLLRTHECFDNIKIDVFVDEFMSGCVVLVFRVGYLLGAELDDAVVVLLRILLLHPSDDFLLPAPIIFLRRNLHLVLVGLEDVGDMIGMDLSGQHVASNACGSGGGGICGVDGCAAAAATGGCR